MPSVDRPSTCPPSACRMQHRAHIGIGQIIRDVVLAGLHVGFHFGKARHVRIRVAVVRILVLRRNHQPLPGQRRNRCFGLLCARRDSPRARRRCRPVQSPSAPPRAKLIPAPPPLRRRARWPPRNPPGCPPSVFRRHFLQPLLALRGHRVSPRASWRASSGCRRRRRYKA